MQIKSLFGTQTVDSILASFEDQREALCNLAAKLGESSAAKTDAANKLLEESRLAGAEQERALRVAKRIGELVG